MLALARTLAEVRHDFFEEWRQERESESKLRVPSPRKEFLAGSVNVGSMLLPGPDVILLLELELSAITLATAAGLAFSEKSRSACVTFGWYSWTASIRAARTKAPRTPVASHAVSRLKLLITSPVNGHFLVFGCFSTWAWFLHSGNTLRKGSGREWHEVKAHLGFIFRPVSVWCGMHFFARFGK